MLFVRIIDTLCNVSNFCFLCFTYERTSTFASRTGKSKSKNSNSKL